MQTITKNTKWRNLLSYIAFAMVSVLALTVSSCDDAEEVTTPTIASLSPSTGSVGTSVTITGTNLADATDVKFGSTSATILTKSATTVTTTVPAGATTGKVSVTTPSGTATSASDFTVTIPVPTIVSVSPESAQEGAAVVITGTNLGDATAVSFNGTAATIASKTATTINTTVPVGATTGKVSVTTPGGTVESANNFTVEPMAVEVVISDFEEEDAATIWGTAEDAGDLEVNEIGSEGDNSFFHLKAKDNNVNYWVGGRYFEHGPDQPLGVEEDALDNVWMNVDVRSHVAKSVGKMVYTVVEAGAPDNRRNYERDFDVTWDEWKTVSIRLDKFGFWNGSGMTDAVTGGADIPTIWSVALFVQGGNGTDTYDLDFDNLRFSEGGPLGEEIDGHH
jgi:hypothetical protein